MDFTSILNLYGEAGKKDKFKDNAEAQRLYSEVISMCESCLSNNKIKEQEIQRILALSYNNRGHLKYLKVDFDGAIEDYTESLVQCESLAVAYYNRGLIHYRLGRFQNGADDMKKALNLDSQFHSAQECLDQCMKNMNSS